MHILAPAVGAIAALAAVLAGCGHQPPAAPVISEHKPAVVGSPS
ncbi:hypothetical protein [Candidatus Mycobacterium methanotrophicum]|nr:hypothetical protein [Candidatus Mycobacterium methanotrophicum]